MAAILFAASIATGAMAAKSSQDAVKATHDAQKQQTAIETEKNKVAARNVLRESRIRRAAIEASAKNTGAEGSGASGAVGSIASMAGSAVGFQGMQAQAARNQTQMLGVAANAQSKAIGWNAASDAFGKMSSFAASQS